MEEKFDSLYSKERIRERMFLLTLSCHLSCDMNRVLNLVSEGKKSYSLEIKRSMYDKRITR